MTISTTTLKNAAKAIGYDLWSDPDGSHYLVDYDGVKLKRWEPEHSSADSFELMVALTIHVQVCRRIVLATMKEYEISRAKGDDASDATRLVILLVASEIGAAL